MLQQGCEQLQSSTVAAISINRSRQAMPAFASKARTQTDCAALACLFEPLRAAQQLPGVIALA
jgi:hypothetical protein